MVKSQCVFIIQQNKTINWHWFYSSFLKFVDGYFGWWPIKYISQTKSNIDIKNKRQQMRTANTSKSQFMTWAWKKEVKTICVNNVANWMKKEYMEREYKVNNTKKKEKKLKYLQYILPQKLTDIRCSGK